MLHRLCANACIPPSPARRSSNGSSGTRPTGWRPGRCERRRTFSACIGARGGATRSTSPRTRGEVELAARPAHLSIAESIQVEMLLMPQPIAGAIVAMVCYGMSDFIYKQATAAGIRADHFLAAQAWFFCPLVTLYALATGTLVLDPAALWGSLAGVFVFVGFYYFLRSLAAGAVSTNAAIFRMNFIVTAALAIALLGEPATPAKFAGLALALLATWLLVGAGSGSE